MSDAPKRRRKQPRPLEGAEMHLFVNALRAFLDLEPLYGKNGAEETVVYHGKRRAQARADADAEANGNAEQPIAAE